MRSKKRTVTATHKKRKPRTRRPEKRVLTAYARKLDAKKLYDLMGALRGPDHADTGAAASLKDLVTGRVRMILFGKRPDSVVANWTLYPVSTYESEHVWINVQLLTATRLARDQEGRDREVWRPTHYMKHLRAAVLASADHPIWNGKAAQIARTLPSTTQP